jgi:hypothetical protein
MFNPKEGLRVLLGVPHWCAPHPLLLSTTAFIDGCCRQGSYVLRGSLETASHGVAQDESKSGVSGR